MASEPIDTHPDALDAQIRLLRQKTTSERFALLCSLTQTAVYHSKRAIARANPQLSKRDRELLFVEVHYGKELAVRLRDYLDGRQQ